MKSQATRNFSQSQEMGFAALSRVNSSHEHKGPYSSDHYLQFDEGLFDDKLQIHGAVLDNVTNSLNLPVMEHALMASSPLNLCLHGSPRDEFFGFYMGPNVPRRARTAPASSDVTTEANGHDNRGSFEEIQSYLSTLTYHFPIRKYPGLYCRLKDILERTIDGRPNDLVANNYVLTILIDSPALMNYTRPFLPPHPEDHTALKEKSKKLMILIDSILFDPE